MAAPAPFTDQPGSCFTCLMANKDSTQDLPYGDPRWFTDGDRALFLHELQHNGGDVKAALDAVNISPLVALRAYKSDPKFKAEWDESVEAASMLLEHHAIKRSTQGNQRTALNDKGEEVEITDKPSDKLLVTLLKARKPDVYSEKVRLADANGQPLQTRDGLIEAILLLAQGKGKSDDKETTGD